jgi:hypothetical protein
MKKMKNQHWGIGDSEIYNLNILHQKQMSYARSGYFILGVLVGILFGLVSIF